MKTCLFTLMMICATAFSVCRAQTPVYLDDSAPLDARVEDALSRMTLREKNRSHPCTVKIQRTRGASAWHPRSLDFRRSPWSSS